MHYICVLYIYIYIYTHTHKHTHTHIYIYMHIHIPSIIYAFYVIHTQTCMYIFTNNVAYIHTNTHKREKYAETHTVVIMTKKWEKKCNLCHVCEKPQTATCKINGNFSTVFNGLFVPVYYWNAVRVIPFYFAICTMNRPDFKHCSGCVWNHV